MSGGYEWPIAENLERRFWEKVDRRSPDECWPWLAFRNESGYGMIRNGPMMALAHRVSHVLHRGERVPVGLQVLHHCDRRSCVNPKHLYVGTNSDNVRDKVTRGRSHVPQPKKRGELHPMAKLSNAQVSEMRARATGRHGEGRALAREYGVSAALVCKILKGQIRPE